MTHPTRTPYLEPDLIQPPIDIAAKYKAIPKSFSAAGMISSVALRRPGR
jgi:hypothetical protein